ncbi:MAG: hypothetical protein ACT4RN_23420 [Pseudonocardia sp.]
MYPLNTDLDASARAGRAGRAAAARPMRSFAYRRIATVVALATTAAVFGAGPVSASPASLNPVGPIAFAQQCIGENGTESFQIELAYIKIDSCRAQELVDSYGNAKDAAGLTGALGAKWWPVGVASGAFFAWAWLNQSQIKSAAAADSGQANLPVGGHHISLSTDS